MQHDNEDNGHFKMRLDDDIEDAVVPKDVDELRLEKISTRVTIISILIPVLIVIVLVIAYLDIKKRVVQTEDTGSMTFQHLSSDLESRFSSLSLRQARLEEQMASFIERNDQVLTRLEIKLKNLEESTTSLIATLVPKKTLDAATGDLDKKINNIALGLENAQSRMSAFDDQRRNEMDQAKRDLERLRADLIALNPRLVEFSEKLTLLEKEKLDKPAMDLALSLEGIRIRQALKVPMDVLLQKVELLEKQVAALKSQGGASTPRPMQPGSQAPPQPLPPVNTTPSGGTIREQPITR